MNYNEILKGRKMSLMEVIFHFHFEGVARYTVSHTQSNMLRVTVTLQRSVR